MRIRSKVPVESPAKHPVSGTKYWTRKEFPEPDYLVQQQSGRMRQEEVRPCTWHTYNMPTASILRNINRNTETISNKPFRRRAKGVPSSIFVGNAQFYLLRIYVSSKTCNCPPVLSSSCTPSRTRCIDSNCPSSLGCGFTNTGGVGKTSGLVWFHPDDVRAGFPAALWEQSQSRPDELLLYISAGRMAFYASILIFR